MNYKIDYSPEFAILTVNLNAGESIVAESDAMVSMTPEVDLKTAARGGVFASLKRKLFTGESIFQNTFTSKGDNQHVKFAPAIMGDIFAYELNGGELLVQSRSYLAGDVEVELDTRWEGFKGFFSGEGLFLIKARGQGTIFLNAYGGIAEIDVKGSHVVDTGFVVAFEPSLSYRVKSVGGIKSLFLSGEGLVSEFSGDGKLWLQTRKAPRLAEFLHPFRPIKQKQDSSD